MNNIKAFLMGVLEFRSDMTTSYDHVGTPEGDRLQEAYEWGRDIAHRLTLRRYDAA